VRPLFAVLIPYENHSPTNTPAAAPWVEALSPEPPRCVTTHGAVRVSLREKASGSQPGALHGVPSTLCHYNPLPTPDSAMQAKQTTNKPN